MSMTSEEAGAGITALADQKNFISITPQGPGDNTHAGGPWYSWNAVGTTQSPGPAGPTCTEKANHPGFCYTSCYVVDGANSTMEDGRALQSYATYSGYASYDPDLPNLCGDDPQCSWTTCHEVVTPTGTGRGDVGGFIPGLFNTLEAELCVDVTREYASGESNGGMMAYQLGVDLAERLAAITPEFGSFHRGFLMAPTEGVALLDLHGSNDDTVPANYSLSADGYFYTPVRQIFDGDEYSPDGWKHANGCSGPTSQYITPYDGTRGLYCVLEGTCTGGDVVRCSWQGGHNWLFDAPGPNGGLVTDFLLRWTKPTHAGQGRKVGGAPTSASRMHHLEVEIDSPDDDLAVSRAAEEVRSRPRVLTPKSTEAHPHYGDPGKGSCNDDEDEISVLAGRLCAPRIGSDQLPGQLPVPHCELGGVSPVQGNGCPTDAPVGAESKAYPLCLATGDVTDPYTRGDFHCVLACPCLGEGADCGAEAHAHCPAGGMCYRALRFRAHGVCGYGRTAAGANATL